MVNYDATPAGARQVSVHPVDRLVVGGHRLLVPGPAVGGALASKSFAHGYVAFGAVPSSCPAAGEMFDLGTGGRDLVQRWVNGQQANNGLSLRASTTDSLGVASGSPAPGQPTRPSSTSPTARTTRRTRSRSPMPNPAVLRTRTARSRSTVTNNGAEAWTPGDYYLAYRVYNARRRGGDASSARRT